MDSEHNCQLCRSLLNREIHNAFHFTPVNIPKYEWNVKCDSTEECGVIPFHCV